MTLKQRLSLSILIYLRELAKLQLKKLNPVVIGVTGSAGKTSLCQAIAAVLKIRYKVKVSEKANSESGIPLNILGLSPKDYSPTDWISLILKAPLKLLSNWESYDIYVAELGIDSPFPPKNMGYLLTIVKPQIGVFLNALPVHTQFFEGLVSQEIRDEKERRRKAVDCIAAEKGKLIGSLPETGWAILNADDLRVKRWKDLTRAKVLMVGTKENPDLKAINIRNSLSGFSLTVKDGDNQQELRINNPLTDHYAYTFLCALAVGKALGVPLADAVRNLTKYFKLPRGRMTLIPGIKGTTILDSSYNASRKTTVDALKLLGEIAPKRKLAILGDMRELGDIGKLEHEEVARVAVKNADLLLTVGPLMQKWFIPEVLKLGFPKEKVVSFLSPYDAADAATNLVMEDDTILIKGSQNDIFLEIVVEKLMRDPKDAQQLLCRRGSFWDAKRGELLNKS